MYASFHTIFGKTESTIKEKADEKIGWKKDKILDYRANIFM